MWDTQYNVSVMSLQFECWYVGSVNWLELCIVLELGPLLTPPSFAAEKSKMVWHPDTRLPRLSRKLAVKLGVWVCNSLSCLILIYVLQMKSVAAVITNTGRRVVMRRKLSRNCAKHLRPKLHTVSTLHFSSLLAGSLLFVKLLMNRPSCEMTRDRAAVGRGIRGGCDRSPYTRRLEAYFVHAPGTTTRWVDSVHTAFELMRMGQVKWDTARTRHVVAGERGRMKTGSDKTTLVELSLQIKSW